MLSRWKILDVEDNTLHAAGRIDVDPQGEFQLEVKHLQTGSSQGVTTITLGNSECQVCVVPTRGMGIHHADVGQWRVGWNAPVRGPVHPRLVPLMEPGGIGWLDGFDELLVRCGLTNNGAPVFTAGGQLQYPLHGRIANTPAYFVEACFDPETEQLRLTGCVEESRLFHGKLRLTSTVTLSRGKAAVEIIDEVTNISAEPGELQLLYHVNFGPPLLETGSRMALTFSQMAPRDARAAEGTAHWNEYGTPEPGFAEQVYFFKPTADETGLCRAILRNAESSRAISLAFDPQQLPCFSQWKSLQSEEDGYVTGLEPATNFPNPRPYEEKQGRVIALEPGETRTFDLALGFHQSRPTIQSLESNICDAQAQSGFMIHESPQTGWSV